MPSYKRDLFSDFISLKCPDKITATTTTDVMVSFRAKAIWFHTFFSQKGAFPFLSIKILHYMCTKQIHNILKGKI